MALIELDRVSLTYPVPRQRRVTLKEFIVRRMYRETMNPVQVVHALTDVCLRIQRGERMGVIGNNGAGKSTLLRVLAGIYPVTNGQRRVVGRISALFALGLGFEMDATGWENIEYLGYLQGETPRSIRAKLDSIGEFSELGEFLDLPVRCYSAGMVVRLAFSIATAIEPEILLVDEVLSVGDLPFQAKAERRMQEMMAKAKIIVVVSHQLDSLAKLCERALWMDRGRVRMVGPIGDVVAAYAESVRVGQSQAA